MWGITISLYLFLAGVSAGAFAIALWGELGTAADDEGSAQAELLVSRIGSVAAAVALVVGTLFLVADARGGLSNPVAFFGLLGNWESPMTWGVAIIIVTLVLEVVTAVRAFGGKRAGKGLAVAGLVFSAALAVYTGLLLGAAQPVPLWNSAALVVLFAASAFLSGSALVLLIAHFAGKYVAGADVDGLVARYEKLLLAVGVVEAVTLFAHLFVVAQEAPAGVASVASLLSGAYALPFWLGIVVVGIALPLVTGSIAVKRQGAQEAAATGTVQLLGFAAIVIGAVVLRVLIIAAAQSTVIAVL